MSTSFNNPSVKKIQFSFYLLLVTEFILNMTTTAETTMCIIYGLQNAEKNAKRIAEKKEQENAVLVARLKDTREALEASQYV